MYEPSTGQSDSLSHNGAVEIARGINRARQILCSLGGLCEVANTLLLVNLEIARGYAELLADKDAREEIFAMVEAEYRKTVKTVKAVMEEEDLSRPFSRFGQRVERRLPVLEQVGRQQIALIRRYREAAAKGKARQEDLVPLLVSINCVAAGLGWTA